MIMIYDDDDDIDCDDGDDIDCDDGDADGDGDAAADDGSYSYFCSTSYEWAREFLDYKTYSAQIYPSISLKTTLMNHL